MANEKSKKDLLKRAEALLLDPEATVGEIDALEEEIHKAETKAGEIPLWTEQFYTARQKLLQKLRELQQESAPSSEYDPYYDLPGEGGRRRKLRLNVKRRGTKRNGRSRKHRKLRKLSTRRR